MTDENTSDTGTEQTPAASHPEQEHPVQDAHGGSMAPSLVDDTGHPVADPDDDPAV